MFRELASVTAVMFDLTLEGSWRSEIADPEDPTPHTIEDFLHSLFEKMLASQTGASMRNIKCISLRIRNREVSYWTNTGSGVEENLWTRLN